MVLTINACRAIQAGDIYVLGGKEYSKRFIYGEVPSRGPIPYHCI